MTAYVRTQLCLYTALRILQYILSCIKVLEIHDRKYAVAFFGLNDRLEEREGVLESFVSLGVECMAVR